MTTEIVIVLALLLAGIPVAKAIERLAVAVHRKRFGVTIGRPDVGPIAFNAAFALILVVLLGFLNIGIDTTTFADFLELVPDILSVLMLSLLPVVITRLVMLLLDKAITGSGIKNLIDNYGKGHLYNVVYWSVAIFLLFSFGSSVFHIAGYDVSPLIGALWNISVPLLIFVLLLLFFSLKDLVSELTQGLYMRNAGILKPGQYLMFDDAEIKVDHMHLCGIVAEDKKNNVFVPYSRLMSGVSVKKTKTVLEKLEDIKEKYVAQDPSYCGPASLSMVLKMFGYDISQQEIGEKAKTKVSKHGEPAGTTPDDLLKVASSVTDGNVQGVWIDADHISDLRTELLKWFENDALVIVDYKKSYLFSNAKKAHYSVCLGVSGDELLILDPSSKAGGVYYADYRRVQAGMDTHSELIGGRRGYMVLAIDGTSAHKRISDGLIYLDETFYDKLTKTISKGLADLQHSSRRITKIFPKRLSNLAGKDEKITRLWRPKNKKDDKE
ncbi:MAG: C39 family peptidase [Candidatus Woesearchaeota archaeon]